MQEYTGEIDDFFFDFAGNVSVFSEMCIYILSCIQVIYRIYHVTESSATYSRSYPLQTHKVVLGVALGRDGDIRIGIQDNIIKRQVCHYAGKSWFMQFACACHLVPAIAIWYIEEIAGRVVVPPYSAASYRYK